MIEKLKITASDTAIILKINELVEFCNDIENARSFLERHEEQIKKLNDAVYESGKDIVFLRRKVLELDDKKSEPDENVQDKFAEQRKWIGKLCKFWDIDNNNLYYGPLTKIHDTSPYCYECNHKICYAFCEPVKDDVIYKGGDNE